MDTNDNQPEVPTAPLPDAHGRAALLLVESLIHGLCEKSHLSARDAVEIAERAVDVEFDLAEATEGSEASKWRSHQLLSEIATSLKIDDLDGPPAVRPVP